MTEGAEIARMLEAVGRDVLSELRNLSEHDLNRSLPLPETNSLFALATHLVGSAEMWVLQMACGRPLARDRDAEFRVRDLTADELIGRLDAADAYLDEVTARITAEDLAAARPRGDRPAETGLHWLISNYGHAREHLAHVQLTKQLYEQQRSEAS